MTKVETGKKVPDFQLPATGGKEIRLEDLEGRKLVLYFYPKDDTPGCTQEGLEFRDLYPEFVAAGAEVLGVSRDNIKSHEKFKDKYDLPFDLLSDTEESLCKAFDVLKEKIMYGRVVFGVERSTFLIDEQGVLAEAWRKVRVKGHAQEVLEEVRNL